MKYLKIENYVYANEVPGHVSDWDLIVFQEVEEEQFMNMFISGEDYFSVGIVPKESYNLEPIPCFLINKDIKTLLHLAFVDEGVWRA